MAALMHDTRAPVDIRERCSEIDPVLVKAITDCLASDPNDRPQTAEDFADAIRHVHDENSTEAN